MTRAIRTSKVLSWRWAPCVALALGACSFSAFAMLVIPERIGNVTAPAPAGAAFRFDSSLASTQTSPDAEGRFANSGSSSTSASFSSLESTQGAARAATNLFPKRGFTPPLERPEQPPAPPPVIPAQPVLDLQQQVAVPVPPPAEAPMPQAQPPASDPQSASLPPDTPRNTE
jgi:hypothetical protein